jgi:hypothetical protein
MTVEQSHFEQFTPTPQESLKYDLLELKLIFSNTIKLGGAFSPAF